MQIEAQNLCLQDRVYLETGAYLSSLSLPPMTCGGGPSVDEKGWRAVVKVESASTGEQDGEREKILLHLVVDLAVAVNVGLADHFVNLLVCEVLAQVGYVSCRDEGVAVLVKHLERLQDLFSESVFFILRSISVKDSE